MADLLARLTDALGASYRIERELGRGGMATVYLAEDLKHRRPVAIKAMHEFIANALGPERFLREIEIAAHLQHPHILPLFDSGDAGGVLYYVMPYVEGETLRGRIVREGQLPVEDACAIARQVASALAYAHGRGIIHRDIKPENIMLPGDVAVVADFGIAKPAAGGTQAGLTSAGMAVGTPHYMSPEQAAGERHLDGRSDQYALACVLYELLAGAPPFTGGSAQAIISRHMVAPPPPLFAMRPSVPMAVQRVIERALAKAPTERFPSIWDFAEALAGALASREVEVQVAPGPAAIPQKRPERGASPNLGALVSKTCDRWRQVNAFDSFFRTNRKEFPGRPQIYLIHGEEGDGHESLVERLIATRIAKFAEDMAGAERGSVMTIRVPWPDQDDQETRRRDLAISLFRELDPRSQGDDLSAAALSKLDALRLVPFVVIQHDLRSRHWDSNTRPVLEWYINDFWGGLPADPDRQVLIFIKAIYPVPASKGLLSGWLGGRQDKKQQIQKELEGVIRAPGLRCPGLVFQELTPITVDDVKEWFSSNGIYPSEQKQREMAESLFRKSDARRMGEIESALEEIHKTFVRDYALERGDLL